MRRVTGHLYSSTDDPVKLSSLQGGFLHVELYKTFSLPSKYQTTLCRIYFLVVPINIMPLISSVVLPFKYLPFSCRS